MVHAVVCTLRRWKQQDQKCKTSLGYSGLKMSLTETLHKTAFKSPVRAGHVDACIQQLVEARGSRILSGSIFQYRCSRLAGKHLVHLPSPAPGWLAESITSLVMSLAGKGSWAAFAEWTYFKNTLSCFIYLKKEKKKTLEVVLDFMGARHIAFRQFTH